MDNTIENKKAGYVITKEPQRLIVEHFRPYDSWISGKCPVCGQIYEGDAYNKVSGEGDLILSIHCKMCNQLLVTKKM